MKGDLEKLSLSMKGQAKQMFFSVLLLRLILLSAGKGRLHNR